MAPAHKYQASDDNVDTPCLLEQKLIDPLGSDHVSCHSYLNSNNEAMITLIKRPNLRIIAGPYKLQ